MKCCCGIKMRFEDCCAPILKGTKLAETPEALMRARYAAFVHGDVDFLVDTIAPEAREEGERAEIERWSKESTWLGLHVRKVEGGGEGDDKGTVEFVARFAARGEEHLHHELASFERRDGRWFFVDGVTPEAKTVVRDAPKVGRNDPCPCGSGKKFKNCHAA